jgi:crotonobetainyl-CoA:carnitine CoA-transferase CaiB-like acyl-CoA transferase
LAISDYAQACQRAKTGIAQHLAQSTRDRGAEIIKIEPREGNAARRIGPFLKDQPVPSARFFGTTTATRKSVPHP